MFMQVFSWLSDFNKKETIKFESKGLVELHQVFNLSISISYFLMCVLTRL